MRARSARKSTTSKRRRTCKSEEFSVRMETNLTLGDDDDDDGMLFSIAPLDLEAHSSLSPEGLAKKLDHFCSDLAHSRKKNTYCDLDGFKVEDNVDKLEQMKELREEIQHRLNAFDREGRTDVNFESAAIAGAKVVVDEEGPATRSITKRLANEAGVSKGSLLYKGIPYEGVESCVSKEIHEQRTDSIVESFVDFQKQLDFKFTVLNHAVRQINFKGKSKSAAPLERLSKQKQICKRNNLKGKQIKKVTRTPIKKGSVDPLRFTKIIDDCALEVASEIVEDGDTRQIWKRKLAPIPFDLDLFDDAEDAENETPIKTK